MRLDPQVVRSQIANLLAAYPDLMADEEDLSLALASETDLDEFLTKLVHTIDDAKALVEGTAARMEELAERQSRFKHRIEAYRSLIFNLMDAAQISKRELPEATLSIRAGQRRVIITDEAALPDEVCTFVRKPDMALIKKILDDRLLEGASLSNAVPNLSIRVK